MKVVRPVLRRRGGRETTLLSGTSLGPLTSKHKTVKPTVYIESSVISYLASRPNRDIVVAGRQAISHDWWTNHRHRFDLRISILVEQEISRGDATAAAQRLEWIAEIPSLSISDEATKSW